VVHAIGHRVSDGFLKTPVTLNAYTHALPGEEAGLSYQPIPSAGADRRWPTASQKLKNGKIRNRLNSLERETGTETATLSLARQDEPEKPPPPTL
jgi:hypothetical protein